jgi:solute:Na+ symporter, SSS family
MVCICTVVFSHAHFNILRHHKLFFMTSFDWIVLTVTLLGMVGYGLYKSRTTKNLEGYFLSNRSMPWYLVLLSIMGTQASAITFLSAPGQAFTDGMRFVQYYFGLPIAMVVICITFVPLFNKLKVYTAYAFLEKRFDNKTRTFTSFLFLLQRGLSTGISIYAPSLILSSLFGWDIFWTNIAMGGLLIIYTVAGGAKAVAYTQQLQLIIIFAAMFLAGYFVVKLLPPGVGFVDALQVSGKLGKMNVITTGQNESGFNWNDRYNIWSGIIGGFFLALSYFGTDQSQVGRYLTAQNNTESRLGLLINGVLKIPMQFFILLIGVLVFAFYQFNAAPLSFNNGLMADVKASV